MLPQAQRLSSSQSCDDWDSAQASGDTLQQLKEAATSVGRTLSDGLTTLTETLSGWLAAPAGEEEHGQARTGSPRCVCMNAHQGFGVLTQACSTVGPVGFFAQLIAGLLLQGGRQAGCAGRCGGLGQPPASQDAARTQRRQALCGWGRGRRRQQERQVRGMLRDVDLTVCIRGVLHEGGLRGCSEVVFMLIEL
jgi:hypothetical protein